MNKTIELLETLQKAYMKEAPNSKEEFIRNNISGLDKYLHEIDPSWNLCNGFYKTGNNDLSFRKHGSV